VIAMTMRVKDVMTWDAVTTEPGALLAQAAALMFEGRFGSLSGHGERQARRHRHGARRAQGAGANPAPVRGIDLDTYLW
jgi:hypothetical protein